MARSFFTHTSTAAIALAANTPKTVAQLLAPANQRVAVQGATVTFDGTVNTAQPVIIKVLRQTTAGTGGTSRAPKHKDDDIATALQTTGLENIVTAEPTAGDQLDILHCHPQTGVQLAFNLPGEYVIGGGDRLGIQVTVPIGGGAVNVLVKVEGEE